MKLDVNKNMEDYYFPLNVDLAQNLLGKMLTHVEAMNLPDKAEKANKDLVRQTFWKWWSDVQENSMTSYRGCIAPIEVIVGVGGKGTWRWHADGNHTLTLP